MALFLVWHDEESAIAPDLAFALDRFELRARADPRRQRPRPVAALPQDQMGTSASTPLLVAPLSDAPRFKRMEKGALKRVRERRRADDRNAG